jgi:hypothetical protein
MHDSGMIIPAYQIPERLGETWDFGQYIQADRPILLQGWQPVVVALCFVHSHDLLQC